MKRSKKPSSCRALAVIPARYGSTRLPGKPLVDLAGKPMVQWVWEAASRTKLADRVVVATDDKRIAEVVEGFGGEAVMTSTRHATGTDRIAEVARKIRAQIYVNVQGDEPLLEPQALDALIAALQGKNAPGMATLVHPLVNQADLGNPAVVKVVMNRQGEALYFSRSPIPHLRELSFAGSKSKGIKFWRHIGLYAFQREALLQFVRWPASALETAECLEQLRALENGMTIRVLPTGFRGVSVDVPSDVARVEALLKAKKRAK